MLSALRRHANLSNCRIALSLSAHVRGSDWWAPGHVLSHHGRALRVAVVGSGPAGFYFVDRAKRMLGEQLTGVDIIDKLPTPFGLVRSGVAPDHPSTKNVENKFAKVAEAPDVRFFGNVEVGTHVTLSELRNMYSAVVLAYGAARDKTLPIHEKGSVANVFTAREFVNWYNGHPDNVDLPVDLRLVKSVAIVGLGNVALDCARILLRPPEQLEATDIADHALSQLRCSSVEEVHVIGRRGPVQANFSGKELREVLDLDNVDVQIDPPTYTPTALDRNEPRKNQKVLEALYKDRPKPQAVQPKRRLTFHFLRQPTAIRSGDKGAVSALALERMALVARADGTQAAEPATSSAPHAESGSDPTRRAGTTGEDLPVDLLLLSVGYRGVSIAGAPFDESRGVVRNDGGRVIHPNGMREAGLYVTGWLRRGAQGIIGSNLVDAEQVAGFLADDLATLSCPVAAADLGDILRERGVDYVDWNAWRRLDAAERELGRAQGRPRVKFVRISEMLAACAPSHPAPS